MPLDLVDDLITPLDAVVAELLAILDPLRPAGHAIATRFGAPLHSLPAIRRRFAAAFETPAIDTLISGGPLSGRWTVRDVSALQELGRRATRGSASDGCAPV